jgi:hypothetical protein
MADAPSPVARFYGILPPKKTTGTGTGMVWLGDFASPPANPNTGDAYHDTTQHKSFTWDGTAWVVVCVDGTAGATGATGAAGAAGPAGPAGAPGGAMNWLGSFATDPPGPAAGDGYFNTTDGNAYTYDGASWNQFAASGAPGAPGAPGVDGNTVLYGAGAPGPGTGVNGNFYIDTTASDLYGPKAGGVWPAGTSLIGPAGAAGADGNTVLYGAGAPGPGDGVDGNFWINTSTNYLYGPKAGGAWPAGISLVGPAGSPGVGVPVGGTAAQLLAKIDGTNYNTHWIDDAGRIFVADSQQCGFVDPAQTTMSVTLDGGTGIYTFHLLDAGAGWDYYRAGIKYHISGDKTVDMVGTPPAAGLYYIGIDAVDGTLMISTIPWTLEDTQVSVATIWFNDGMTPKYYLADERHTVLMDRRVHDYLHKTRGTQVYGFPTLTGPDVAPVIPTDANNTYGITSTTLFDEDIVETLAQLIRPAGVTSDYTIFYRTALTTYGWQASVEPFLYGGGSYIQYDNAGTLTTGISNRYYNTYILLFDLESTIHPLLVGRGEFTTLAAAQAEDPTTFTLTGLNVSEIVFAYQFTWHTLAAYGTLGKCRLAAAPKRIALNNLGVVSGGSSAINGLPAGGTAGQKLIKNSAIAYDVSWVSGSVRTVVLCSAYTPLLLGADAAEVTVPYDYDGTTSLTWNVVRLTLRVGTAGGTPGVTVEKSTAATAFSAASVGSVALGAGAYEGSTTAGLGTVASGNKLRFTVDALGTAQNWTVLVDLAQA